MCPHNNAIAGLYLQFLLRRSAEVPFVPVFAVPPDLEAEPGNEGDHEPDQNKRGDHPASAVPKQVVVNGHYQQYDGCQQVEDRQDRIQPAEGFAEKLTGVDILEYRVEKRGKLVVFHTH